MTARLKQVLLSLINATLILGIVFLLLGLALLDRAGSFATDIVSDVKIGLLKDADREIKTVPTSIRTSEQDLRVIADRLEHIVGQAEIRVSPEVEADLRSIDARLVASTEAFSRCS